MKLENEFTVPVDIDTVYQALNDPERVTPCFPGATLDSHDGNDFTGTVKVKLGPVSMTYKGKGSFVERDAVNHKVVVDAHGRDARGNGTASAKATLTMTDEGGKTKVTVLTEMQVTGKPAQFGRGVISDVGDKILGQFAACLADEFADSSGSSGSSEPGPVGGDATARSTVADTPTATPAAPTPVASGSGPPEPAPMPTTAAEAAGTGSVGASPGAGPPSGGVAGASVSSGSVGSAGSVGAATGRPRHQRVEEIDLLDSSRDAILGRLTSPPVLAGVGVIAVLAVLFAVLRRRRR